MDIHVINVNSDALKFITEALSKNPGMYPRIVLRSGGCAGNMLLLTLDTIYVGDIECSSNGITFVIEPVAEPYTEDITICVKPGLTPEILIHNNIKKTCRCGKSFKA